MEKIRNYNENNMAYICYFRNLMKQDVNRYVIMMKDLGHNGFAVKYQMLDDYMAPEVLETFWKDEKDKAFKKFYAPLQKDLELLPKGMIPVNREYLLEPFEEELNLKESAVLCYNVFDLRLLDLKDRANLFNMHNAFKAMNEHYLTMSTQHMIVQEPNGRTSLTTYNRYKATKHITNAPLKNILNMSRATMGIFGNRLLEI